MVRMQVRLTELQFEALRARANAEHRSMADVIRGLVDELLSGSCRQRTEERRRRALSAIGRAGKNGPRDLSRRHDTYLVDAYR